MGSSWEVRDQNSINGVDECLMSGRVYYFFIMNEFESQITVLSNLIARICIILPFRFITPIGCSTQHCSQLATCLWFEAQTKAVWMQFQSFRCLASRRMLSKCSRHQQGQKYENIWKMKKNKYMICIYTRQYIKTSLPRIWYKCFEPPEMVSTWFAFGDFYMISFKLCTLRTDSSLKVMQFRLFKLFLEVGHPTLPRFFFYRT